MQRGQWSRVVGYLRSSLWVVPLVAIPLGMIATRILHWLDGQLAWAFSGLAVTGARALLDAVITSSLSFMVFTFGSLLWIPYHRLARASGENRVDINDGTGHVLVGSYGQGEVDWTLADGSEGYLRSRGLLH